jgi:hypothetical protein
MPINNLWLAQLDPNTAMTVIAKLQEVLNTINPICRNLTPEERKQFGSINERNKLITGKAQDFHKQQPALQSPDVNWQLFDDSWNTRTSLAAIEALCNSIIEVASDTRILHDYDLYQMTLTDYDYTKYKAGSTIAAGGFTTKYEEMKQFFPGTGGNGNPSPAPPTNTQ